MAQQPALEHHPRRKDHPSLRIVVTGGAGFLGQRLIRLLLATPTPVELNGEPANVREIVSLDRAAPLVSDRRVHASIGDVADRESVRRVITPDTDAVFHLAAVVSGQAEAEFDTGMRVNLTGALEVLEACRAIPRPPRVIFTSSVAVYGGDLPPTVQDATALWPQNSYGTQKAIAELLLNDYSRKGYVDGRALRLPTISVRPGKPNLAASGFASGIIREPLHGIDAVCPVSPDTPVWLLSPRRAVEGLVAGLNLSADALGPYRALNLPGISVTPREMVAALGRVAGPDVAARVRWELDPAIQRIIGSWPARWDTRHAESLGFRGEPDFDSIIRAYIAEEHPAAGLRTPP